MDFCTPTELAVELWGDLHNESHSQGARNVRRIARELFPEDAPGMGGRWILTPDMQQAIRREVYAGR